jgi:hypothetical protein
MFAVLHPYLTVSRLLVPDDVHDIRHIAVVAAYKFCLTRCNKAP